MTSIADDKIQLFNPNDEQKVCINKVNNFIREHLAFSKILISKTIFQMFISTILTFKTIFNI